jgi:acetyltransferase-like isoleucine patch superfamily enzyme
LLSGRRPYFAGTATIGRNVRFGRNVVFNSSRVRIGDGTVFGDDVRVDADQFEIGDYGTVYKACFFPGPGSVSIGHNFWMGTLAIVDAMGGVEIGDNVCVGVDSQLWTHMSFGDVVVGCRFDTVRRMRVGDDAWIAARCLASPAEIGARSLAMPGSLITKDMRADRTYAGSPAEDVTERLGPQFSPTSIPERLQAMNELVDGFCSAHGPSARSAFMITADAAEAKIAPAEVTVFNVADRTYTKHATRLEHDFMRFLLPRAKFVPAPRS